MSTGGFGGGGGGGAFSGRDDAPSGGGSSGGGSPSAPDDGYVYFTGNVCFKFYGSTGAYHLVGTDGKCYSNRPQSKFENGKYVYYEGSGARSMDSLLMGQTLTVRVPASAIPADFELEGSFAAVWLYYDGHVGLELYFNAAPEYAQNDQIGTSSYVKSIDYHDMTNELHFYSSNDGRSYSYDGSVLTLGTPQHFEYRATDPKTRSGGLRPILIPYGFGDGASDPSGGDEPSAPVHEPHSVYTDPEPDHPTGGTVTNVYDYTTTTTYDETNNTYNTTYNYTTTTDVDLSPVTSRQDREIALIKQLGIDLDAYLYDLNDTLEDLGDFVMGGFAEVVGWLQRIHARLGLVLDELEDLDHSTGDLVDLSGVETYLEKILSAITNYQDEDSGVSTIRGDVFGILAELKDLDFPVADLSNIESELDEWHGDFVGFWQDVSEQIDTIIYDLEHLDFGARRTTPTVPDLPAPDDETGLVPWEELLNLTALRDAVTRLMSKFPFATINNFVLILTALVRPAQAPVFDLPMPNPSDWSSPYMVNVDLSDWDVPAAVLRTGIMLWAIARVSRRTVAMWTREEGGGDA